jgi:hypothetical protein
MHHNKYIILFNERKKHVSLYAGCKYLCKTQPGLNRNLPYQKIAPVLKMQSGNQCEIPFKK